MHPSPSPPAPSFLWSHHHNPDRMEPKDDIRQVHVLLKNGNMQSQGRAAGHFSWEATHPAATDPTDPHDPSRCSLLIHEVSLLVGLAPDDLYPADDSFPLVPNRSKVPDILPLTPTKSLASGRLRHTGLPLPTDANIHVRPSVISAPSLVNPRPDNSITPFARQRNHSSVRPSPSPSRRRGQVFCFEPPLCDAPLQNAVGLDETFIHPREPPPKPPPNSPANRCSSLDRLERSLLKLEAHAPRNHRKSQSEERPPHHIAHWRDRRPSLPPPRRVRKEQSRHEIIHRNPSRPAYAHRSFDPPPVPKLSPLHQNVTPKICPIIPLDEDRTPSSFMDMDIPCAEEISQKQQASFRRPTGREKMMNLVRAAKTASRGVIAWGKSLTRPTKSSATGQETTTDQNSRL